LLSVLATGSLLGCDSAPQLATFPVALRIQSDPGRPLAGARVVYRGEAAHVSDDQGLVALSLQGVEGTSVSFNIECPEGHRAPSAPLSVVLRRANEADRRPEYAVLCPPLFRTVVVAVRAERGASLPVVQLGREVGRTDASGAAHVVLQSAPEETVELTLDTSAHPLLRPRNPTTRFRVGQSDDILVFNQAFNSDKPKLVVRSKPRSEGPIRIQ
jgi:hypothetical protein